MDHVGYTSCLAEPNLWLRVSKLNYGTEYSIQSALKNLKSFLKKHGQSLRRGTNSRRGGISTNMHPYSRISRHVFTALARILSAVGNKFSTHKRSYMHYFRLMSKVSAPELINVNMLISYVMPTNGHFRYKKI